MRHIFTGIAALLISLPSAATVITYDYIGRVQQLEQWNGGLVPDTVLSETNVIPGSVRLGDTFRGRFSFDTNARRSISNPYGTDFARNDKPAAFASTLTFDRSGLSLSSPEEMPLVMVYSASFDSTSTDIVIMPNFRATGPVNVSVNFQGADAGTVSPFALPDPYDLRLFGSHTLDLTWYGENNQTIELIGNLERIVSWTVVPEPSTYALLAISLAGMGASLRRTKSQAEAC